MWLCPQNLWLMEKTLFSNPLSGPKETWDKWLPVVLISIPKHLASRLSSASQLPVTESTLAPLSSSHPTLSPKLHLTGFPFPFHIYRTLPVWPYTLLPSLLFAFLFLSLFRLSLACWQYLVYCFLSLLRTLADTSGCRIPHI